MKTGIIFLIVGLAFAQALWGQQPSANAIHFGLHSFEGNYFLLVKTNEYQKKITIPQKWLVPPDTAENGYVSTTNYDTIVTSFKIDEGQIGLHLSSYEIQKEGSAQAAAGRDVFLVYDWENHTVHPGIIGLGITKERIRSMGFFATNTKFLISDINHDGLADIGIIKEELKCQQFVQQNDSMDIITSPFYKLHPIRWYTFQEDRWAQNNRYDGEYPTMSYKELPLIGLIKSPVDFVKEICFGRNILLLGYADFGVQSMAYELVGFQWYQWDSHGDLHPGTKYDIKVIVYKDIDLEEVQKLYPVDKDKKQDYRYVAYDKALEYLDQQMQQIEELQKSDSGRQNADLYEDLISTLGNTRSVIVNRLGI
jgi:hypothetical protein